MPAVLPNPGEPIWCNVGPGQFPAPEPWLNLDVHEGDGVNPDIVVEDPMQPLAGFDEGSVDRVYLGHVLEHIPWPDVGPFLRDIYRAMRPGGQLCIVGPDVYRIIRRWKDNLDPEGWMLVESVLENPWARDYTSDPAEAPYAFSYEEPSWPYARHWWNCSERRVLHALTEYTDFVDVTALPINFAALGDWPVVAYTQWQCAASARREGG